MNSDDLDLITSLLEKDTALGETIRDQATALDKKTRAIVGMLNKIHWTSVQSLPDLVDTVRPMIKDCQENTEAIALLIPSHQFWRWNNIWHRQLQTAVFAATMVEYLSTGKLLSLPQVSEVLGSGYPFNADGFPGADIPLVQEDWHDRFYLQAEDYLMGLISLVNELSRYCVNVVTMGNYEEPIRISAFVKDIFAGFSVLNLKNDNLRRRFDSLKYDIKKIEEVVYDLSIRKLTPLIQEPQEVSHLAPS